MTSGGTTEYTPLNNTLTAANLASTLVAVLGIPIGFVNPILGAIISGASLLAGEIISWQQSKIPHLACTTYNHSARFGHYGNAPIYDQGYGPTLTGKKYVVMDTNEQSEYSGNIFYTGMVIENKDNQTADKIYNALYSYTPYAFVI